MRNHITTIDINEVITVVSIDFEAGYDWVEIDRITDLETGEAIAPDLLGETDTDELHRLCHEFAADYDADMKVGRFA